ncbi:MAG: hypothetical protein MJE77_17015 [Proteobacteria bacterium]|nr:hypothetical protein [Pseudomonadota bacterium]
METLLVRLKPYDPRRGYVIRRYTYRGIKFQQERGWYRVQKDVADYLRGVRQIAQDEHSPAAFDVHSPEEAKVLDEREKEQNETRQAATDHLKLSVARCGGTESSDDTPRRQTGQDGSGNRRHRKR